MNEEQLVFWEDSAFYESGLSADGCLEKLDQYAKEAIKRYGRYLLKNKNKILKQNLEDTKQDLKRADYEYIKLIKELTKKMNNPDEQLISTIDHLANEVANLTKEKILLGHQISEADERNATFELQQKLTQALEENNNLKEVSKKLYIVVLQVYEMSRQKPVVVIGPGLFHEARYAIKQYEQTNDIRKI